MLRGALIGVGNVALAGRWPAWLERRDVALVAASDPRETGRPKLESAAPGIRWYGSAEELLGRERLDFVDIATPPALHARFAREALRRGLHVLCEKPLVVDARELPALASLAGRSGRVLNTVHNWSHAPILAKARELIERGELGEIRRCLWKTLRREPAAASGPENWRVDPAVSGGGILVDHGWHAFYIVNGWMRRPPLRLRARIESGRAGNEDAAAVVLEYERGSAEIVLTWKAQERANGAEIEGERGVLRMMDMVLEAPGTVLEFPEPLSKGSHHPDWFGGVIDDFLAEIAGARPRGSNLAEASLCAELVALGYESARRGGEPLPVSGTLASEAISS